MIRPISQDEREDLIHELTGEHYEALHRQLQGGNVDLINTIDEAAFASLPGSFWRDLVMDAAFNNHLSIGGRIVKLVENALLAQAEIDAIKEVEQMEWNREESRAEQRIDRAVMHLVMTERA